MVCEYFNGDSEREELFQKGYNIVISWHCACKPKRALAPLASLPASDESAKPATVLDPWTHGPSVASGASASLRGEPSKSSFPAFPAFLEMAKMECSMKGLTCIVAKEQPAGYPIGIKQDCWCKWED